MNFQSVGVNLASCRGGGVKCACKKETAAPYATSPVNNFEFPKMTLNQVAFGKKLSEHRSWGARVNPDTKEVSFKLFTFPDAQAVSALVYKKWKKEPDEYPLENKGGGVFELQGLSPKKVKAGDKYLFQITKADGTVDCVKDPYSFKQEKINGASTIYDHSSYEWKNDAAWKNNPNRITARSNGTDGHKSVREARIYALNPDSVTDERSYEGVISKLDEIKQSGFNTVEIMHIENTFDCNWGYDGVDKSAPSSYLGGPDKLKELVDEAHGRGLNVVFDVVPNHQGPDGNQLRRTGPYIKGPNDFGDAFNYEGENSEHVRDFMINSMLNWLDNYHVDGLRLDMTKYMQSDYTLRELSADINYHFPDCFTIAEDGRDHVRLDENGEPVYEDWSQCYDYRVTRQLTPDQYGGGESEERHEEITKGILGYAPCLNALGMDSEWAFDYYHRLNDTLYNPQDTQSLSESILQSAHAVKYAMSHDEIGNYEGTRRIAKMMVPKLNLNDNIVLGQKDKIRAHKLMTEKGLSKDDANYRVRCQKAQMTSERLAIMYQTGELDKYKIQSGASSKERKDIGDAFRAEVLSPLGISENSNLSYSKIARAFDEAFEQTKAAQALTFGIPGPKMVFQGDDKADLTPFRFFRRFESVKHEDYLETEKGYKSGKSALIESTMGQIPYSKEGAARMEKFSALTQDLNRLNEENQALTLGSIEPDSVIRTYYDQSKRHNEGIIGHNSKYGDNEIFTISNISGFNRDGSLEIRMPKGTWVEVLNTDDEKYGGKSEFLNPKPIQSNGEKGSKISLAGYSTAYFKKVA